MVSVDRFRIACLCLACVGWDQIGWATEPSPFSLRAEVIEAIAGGPVVIKGMLSYRGTHKLYVFKFFSHAELEAPRVWRQQKGSCREPVQSEYLKTYTEVVPGDERSELLVAHYTHEIPAGKVAVAVTWSLCGAIDEKAKDIKDIRNPTTKLVVNVLPATAENLLSLQTRLIDRVKHPASSELRQKDLADMVLFTKHRELLPAAWAMIETAPSEYPFGALFSHIYQLSSQDDKLHERAIRLISQLSWNEWKSYPFLYWRSHKTTLPSKCLRTLMNDSDFWVRVLTYETFGEKCDRAWVRSLLAELRQAATPLPKELFARLLAELDDDRFQIREKATNKLIQLAPRVETQLKHCDQASLSPEAARRVRHILTTIVERRSETPPSCVLNCLDVEAPLAQTFAILRALSEGPPDAWLTKEAQVRLSAKLKRKAR